jgi:hypothetical protein
MRELLKKEERKRRVQGPVPLAKGERRTVDSSEAVLRVKQRFV